MYKESGQDWNQKKKKKKKKKKKSIRMLRDIADKKKKAVSDWTEVDGSFCIYERFTPKCIFLIADQL